MPHDLTARFDDAKVEVMLAEEELRRRIAELGAEIGRATSELQSHA